jgi:IPT/TIG domain
MSRAGALGVLGVVVVAVVLAIVVGGLLKVRTQSVGYERAIDRSYAAQARLFVEASNRLAKEFRTVVAGMPGDDRTTLQQALDTLVRSTASLAAEAATAASPAPTGGAGADVATSMADRARAMGDLRTAVDGLLGMAPLRVVGAPDPSESPGAVRPLSAAGAAADLTKVGVLLAQGDRLYASGRRALRGAPGRALLPASVWSGRTEAWTSSGALAVVDALSSSPTLAAVHQVELVTDALALTPAPVPGVGAAPGAASVLPPTGHLRVAVVVANTGNVAERGVVVRATVALVGATGSAATARPGRSRRVGLTAHSSASVTLPPVTVVPGNTYTVVVTVDPPVPNVAGTVTSDSVSVHVAPPAPPTVSQLLPVKGPEKGGTDVTIVGTGFTWVSAVTFGTTPTRFKVVSSTEITAVAPAGTGTTEVHVTNPGGVSATSTADRFRYRRK